MSYPNCNLHQQNWHWCNPIHQF